MSNTSARNCLGAGSADYARRLVRADGTRSRNWLLRSGNITPGPANIGGLDNITVDPSGTGNALEQTGSIVMRGLFILCIAVGVSLTGTSAFARGGMSSSHMSMTGGAFGTSAASPGTNSLGTALPSSGTGSAMKGAELGTSPAIDREEAKVDKMIGSICRGC